MTCPTGRHLVLPDDPAELVERTRSECAQVCADPAPTGAPAVEQQPRNGHRVAYDPYSGIPTLGEQLQGQQDAGGTPQGHPTQAADQAKGQQGQQGQGDRRTRWTGAELMAEWFPPQRWAVRGVLAEGVNLFAGAPKIGKSWFALGLGVAVASGGKAFGTIDVTAGDVFYLALEDSGRRLQDRLTRVLGADPAPDRLTVETRCPPGEVDACLTDWLEANPGARLVMIDVLAKVRAPVSANSNAYQVDYAAVTRFEQLAQHYSVAFLLVHHQRKQKADDHLEEVSGTLGLTGAAAATLTLKRERGKADAVLKVSGRDVPDAEYAMTFDADLGAWRMLDGPAEDYLLADTRLAILRHVRQAPGSTPKQTSDATGLDYELVKRTAARMAKDGQLDRDNSGRYTPVPAVPPVPGEQSEQVSDDAEQGQQGDTECPPVPADCPRCHQPADRLVPYPNGDQLGACCAYPAGGSPDEQETT